MVQKGQCGLKCTVLGDRFGLISRNSLLFSCNINIIYTAFPSGLQEIQDIRLAKGLPELPVHEIEHNVFDKSMIYLDNLGFNIPQYSRVAVGGTFDRLHNGHRKLLTQACSICNGTLVIGIISDDLLKNKKGAEFISCYEYRLNEVEKFVRTIKPNIILELPKLSDPYGPTISDPSIQAIVVSSETIIGAKKINELRCKKGMSPLSILVTRRADGAILSSTFLRSKGMS